MDRTSQIEAQVKGFTNDMKQILPRDKVYKIDTVIEAFSHNLKDLLQDNLSSLVLFGSRAMGNAREDSDYDLLIIVNDKDKRVEENISELAGKIFFEQSKIISFILWSNSDWNFNQRMPIAKSILRNGILLN